MSAEPDSRPSRARAYIALGSNLGDRRANLDAAIAALRACAGVEVRRVSSWVDTEPVGGPPGQPRFLNGAAELDTSLTARNLLRQLLAIEARYGRTREAHHGPRTLDLDLLLYGDRIIDEPDLQVPHPRMTSRRFVLEPLAEIAPQAWHPVARATIGDLLERLGRSSEPSR